MLTGYLNDLRFQRATSAQLANSGFNSLKIAQNHFRRVDPGGFPIVSTFKKLKDFSYLSRRSARI